MKTKDSRVKAKGLSVIKFCDLTASEESRLRLIANLLLQTSEVLSPTDAAEIGYQIRRFLEKKVILEHLFFGRTVSCCSMSKDQLSLEVAALKKVILSESSWN